MPAIVAALPVWNHKAVTCPQLWTQLGTTPSRCYPCEGELAGLLIRAVESGATAGARVSVRTRRAGQ